MQILWDSTFWVIMKDERMAKRSSFGSIVRKRLSDITNSQSQPKLGSQAKNQQPTSNSTEELINQLLKEKASMMKLIEERDKIIALADSQLRNLRMDYQKLLLQNWNLAQSNSQMLAELNLGREKVKALQHGFVCKDALLKAKSCVSQGKTGTKDENNGLQEGECLLRANTDNKAGNRVKRQTARSRSMGPSTAPRQGVEKEKLENKRRCLRRQSAKFKSEPQEPKENLFEIEDAKFPMAHPLDNPMLEESLILSSSSLMKEETSDPNEAFGRPMRRAAEKVQSYKEIPRNIKMRRKE